MESPAKAKTINKILGSDYIVKSSVGHVRDLPERKLGVDVEHNFQPEYVVLKGKKKVIDELKSAAKSCDEIYLAPDPDREGEAIAWHIQELLKPGNAGKAFHRVQYNEITPQAVRHALDNPGKINMNRVDAQQARRVLDRLVGYMVSPVLWRQVRRGLSAGRVQSVALRLVCERESEIRKFTAQSFWLLGAKVRNDEKADIRTVEQSVQIRSDLEGRGLEVAEVVTREINKRPPPPFITSTLQQAASSYLSFSTKRTMTIAQRLYEGIDLGNGPAGLITYMRTDSVTVAKEAMDACRQLVVEQYGAEYCPERPNVYHSRANAQEAHEAVRPTDVRRTPESLASHLDATDLKLYRLIWQRFVASQMVPAKIDQRIVKIQALPQPERPTRYLFQVSASQVRFPGYMKVTGVDVTVKKTENDEDREQENLPPLVQGEQLECMEWLTEEKETKPPARYTESSLVRALEGNGIGRPSTYAQIITTLQQRTYVNNEKRSLVPTALGMQVSEILVRLLEALFNVSFTAEMEAKLDEVEAGAVQWLDSFYKRFQEWMKATQEVAPDQAIPLRLLDLLQGVQNWRPPAEGVKRAFSDEKFVTSVRKQLTEGRKSISQRQVDALVRMAVQYREQLPAVDEVIKQLGLEAPMAALVAPPDAASLLKLELMGKVELDGFAIKFVNSLKMRTNAGRGLSPAQSATLDKIVLRHADSIPDFDAIRPQLNIEEVSQQTSGEPDRESEVLLAALTVVKEWNAPVKRGKMVFDDQAFNRSLAQQYARKHALSDKQRAALRKMVARYRAQITNFDELAQQFGIEDKKGGKSAARPPEQDA